MPSKDKINYIYINDSKMVDYDYLCYMFTSNIIIDILNLQVQPNGAGNIVEYIKAIIKQTLKTDDKLKNKYKINFI